MGRKKLPADERKSDYVIFRAEPFFKSYLKKLAKLHERNLVTEIRYALKYYIREHIENGNLKQEILDEDWFRGELEKIK